MGGKGTGGGGGGAREGSLEAPTRHPVPWKTDEFHDESKLFAELERVYDICHGCRRCFSLCNAFPVLFDAIDETDSGELEGVPRAVYWQVVDHCYLCDMCYMSKCPYVPPHPWNLDFPHLMLRAKAIKFRKGEVRTRDKVLSATDTVGRLAGIPVVSGIVNAVNASGVGRSLLEKTLGVHPQAPIPKYHSDSGRSRSRPATAIATSPTWLRTSRACFATTAYRSRSRHASSAAACPSWNWATSSPSSAPRTATSRNLRGWSTWAGTWWRRCLPAR
jgi:glycerol-3-phosphate dehydrogenase subunit C